jgi:hypothetical protein
MAWWISLLIGLALSVVSYLLAPKPKKQQPPAAAPMDDPTAEAGRPIPVLFGTHIFKDPNILWFGDKISQNHEIKA